MKKLKNRLLMEFLVRLVEMSQDVFWIRDATYGAQIYISPSYQKVWQRSCDSLYNNPEAWADYLVEEDRLRMENSLSKRNPKVSPEQIFCETYRIYRPDGSIRWICDNSFPIYDENNSHIGFAGIARDITKEKDKEIRDRARNNFNIF